MKKSAVALVYLFLFGGGKPVRDHVSVAAKRLLLVLGKVHFANLKVLSKVHILRYKLSSITTFHEIVMKSNL